MNKELLKVLNACIKLARSGEISVFDLMYETGFAYPELKVMLDKLVTENELEATDIKTYKFIGNTERKFEEPEPPKVSKNSSLDDRIAELERRRQEYLEMMRQEAEEDEALRLLDEDDDCDEEGEELIHCDDDEEMDNKFAEYERYLREHTLEEVYDNEKPEELIGFVVALMREGHKNPAVGIMPACTEWDDEDKFLRFCAERIIGHISRNKDTGRQGVIKIAVFELAEIIEGNCTKLIEVHERVVYELKNMSNYYFNKIRLQCP